MRTDKVTLIAGGAGSIGSALAERLALAGGSDLILIDKDENRLEDLRIRLADKGVDNLTIYVGDIRNYNHLKRIFVRHSPDIIFNCSAHKHVISSQRNVSETTRNNLLTTLNLLKARHSNRHSKLIHISTDKAVNPSNVMGASKTLCECMVRHEYPKSSDRNSIVRFGNVRYSQGSVLEIWARQVKDKLPLTVTDPDMTRFMMSIDDACSQIMRLVNLEAGTYVLDMGEPQTISDLLRQFKDDMKLNSDYPVKLIGRKAGEKKHESLLWGAECFECVRSGNVRMSKILNSPIFDYMKALEVSGSYDDERTMKHLKLLFGGSIA